MSVLEKIASSLGRNDELPNQELARELVAGNDTEGVREIAENLWNNKTAVRSDCIKVIYEIGALKPELIAEYYPNFLRLLISRENRMVWGAMYALAAVAHLKADELYRSVPAIKKAMEQGSVITVDNGVKALAAIAAYNADYQKEIAPYLLEHLRKCRTKEVPQHAESTLIAISCEFVAPYRQILLERMEEMTPPQAARIRKILKSLS
jgi:hypothetical protein